ncbi:ABC transporter permease [Candidatus Sumerlaeota bacterium]|nr:ABC transporter permease [Candidatus Sumerlaeota bacterium]
MNLAVKDIRHNIGRFFLTAIGIGMLLMIVMGMGGIYRGIIEDATLLIDSLDVDFWVAQRGTRGPFAEVSRLPNNLVDRVAAVPGVAQARKFVFHTIQREIHGKPLRIAVLGLDWPQDHGEWLPLISGRCLAQSHYEMIADRTLGLGLGERLQLGKDFFTVVGLTSGMIDSGGNGLAFFTVSDAQAIQFDITGESIRLERAARLGRASRIDLSRIQPSLAERAEGESSIIPALAPPSISAVVLRLESGADPHEVATTISGWADVTVYTGNEERALMLAGPVEKAKLQIGLFRMLLTIISAIIMALILYTLTLDKLHDIALLKLIGAPNRVILGMIMQQALLLGAFGYGIAFMLGQKIFPRFPRRVILMDDDLVRLAVIVVVISILSSFLGVWKAMKVKPNEALS